MNTDYLLNRAKELDRRYQAYDDAMRAIPHAKGMQEIHAAFVAADAAWRHYCDLRDMLPILPARLGEVGCGVN